MTSLWNCAKPTIILGNLSYDSPHSSDFNNSAQQSHQSSIFPLFLLPAVNHLEKLLLRCAFQALLHLIQILHIELIGQSNNISAKAMLMYALCQELQDPVRYV